METISGHILWDSQECVGYIGILWTLKEPKKIADQWVSFFEKRKAGLFTISRPTVLDAKKYKWEIKISESPYCPRLLEVFNWVDLNVTPFRYDLLFRQEFPEFAKNMLPDYEQKPVVKHKYKIKANLKLVWEGDDYEPQLEVVKTDPKSQFISVLRIDGGLLEPVLAISKRNGQWV
jgi:hypothetical protein